MYIWEISAGKQKQKTAKWKFENQKNTISEIKTSHRSLNKRMEMTVSQ